MVFVSWPDNRIPKLSVEIYFFKQSAATVATRKSEDHTRQDETRVVVTGGGIQFNKGRNRRPAKFRSFSDRPWISLRSPQGHSSDLPRRVHGETGLGGRWSCRDSNKWSGREANVGSRPRIASRFPRTSPREKKRQKKRGTHGTPKKVARGRSLARSLAPRTDLRIPRRARATRCEDRTRPCRVTSPSRLEGGILVQFYLGVELTDATTRRCRTVKHATAERRYLRAQRRLNASRDAPGCASGLESREGCWNSMNAF